MRCFFREPCLFIKHQPANIIVLLAQKKRESNSSTALVMLLQLKEKKLQNFDKFLVMLVQLKERSTWKRRN